MIENPRILILEDVVTDAELAMRELRRAQINFEARRVETREAFLKELEDFDPDVILSDYGLRQFNGMEALGILKELNRSTPFILYTGSLTEEVAVECMKLGATDYILKSSLRRLPSAVMNALEKHETRRSREQAVAALRESEARYRQLFDSNPMPTWVFDTESYRFLAVNEEAVHHYGYSRQEFLSMTIKDIRPPEDIPVLVDSVKRSFGYQKFIPSRHLKKDGTIIEVEISGRPIAFGGKKAGLVLANDVTERNQIQRELEEKDLRLREAQEIAHLGSWEWDIVEDRVTWSDELYRIFGIEKDDRPLTSKMVYEFVHPDDREMLLEYYKQSLKTKEFSSCEHRIIRHDGEERVLYETAVVTAGDNGRAVKMTGIVQDITERKQAERALQEANESAIIEYERLVTRITTLAQALGTVHDLQSIFRALTDFALISTPCNGLFVSLLEPERRMRRAVYAWSDAGEEDVSRLPELPLTDSPSSRAVTTGEVITTDDFQNAMVGKPGINMGLEVNPQLPQSSLAVPMAIMGKVIGAIEVQSTEPAAFKESHVTAMRMAANLTAMAVENLRFVEREREREEQLRQAQKMESIGTLTGGVAHDFNNLLTAILGNAELALSRMRSDDFLRSRLLEIEKAGNRAAVLTRQLLAFSRRQKLQRRNINLNEAISEIMKLLERIIGADVEVSVELAPDLWTVFADSAQIEQVLMNLSVNARDAMPDGGRLTIETRNVELDEEDSHRFPDTHPGRFVQMIITDEGTGIDEETQARIFEPFFTTKEVGKGTGLGLAMVYGIVKQHDGHISVQSEPGRGTTFTVLLPAVDQAVEESTEAERRSIEGGSETILVAEDEEQLRVLTKSVLEGLGYTVLLAANGEEAVDTFKQNREKIDLLLFDLVMPRMGGAEAYLKIREMGSEKPLIFMTGYSSEAVQNRLNENIGAPIIQKPYSFEFLARQVREVLGVARTGSRRPGQNK